VKQYIDTLGEQDAFSPDVRRVSLLLLQSKLCIVNLDLAKQAQHCTYRTMTQNDNPSPCTRVADRIIGCINGAGLAPG
jgi:hypothetical protein